MSSEDAGVGSISHILKTAFKDVYQDNARREAAKAAKLEAAAAAAAAAAAEGGGGGGGEAAEAVVEQQQEEEGGGEGYEETKGKEALEVEAEDASLTKVERMNLRANLLEMMSTRKAEIDSTLLEKTRLASELATYLKSKRDEAHVAEEKEEERLKKQGIMIGQHIPSLPSKLTLDTTVMGEYGDYSSNLIVARELVGQNKVNTLRRTGNLPISELAEQKKLERSKKAPSAGEDTGAHYLLKTGNAEVRHQKIAVRFAATIKAREDEQAELAASGKLKSPKKHYPPLKEMLTATQKHANEDILKGMNHKLNYLRNPRNIPSTITRLITKGEISFERDAAAAAAAAAGGGVSEESDVQSHSSSHSHASGKSKRSQMTVPKVTAPLFATDPSFLSFNEYEVGKLYTLPVQFRNVSAISRIVRVLPPRTPVFSISEMKYPNRQKGVCAPGMSVSTIINFMPDSLGDYEDSLYVETEGGSYPVAIVARREAPKLSVPANINLGGCLVGDAMRVQIKCENSGGAGKFRLLRGEDYPNVPEGVDWNTMGCLRMHPFTVYPVEFSLQRGEAVDLNIEFVPLQLGDFTDTFVMMCDNTQVFSYKLMASAKQLNLSIIEVNQVPFEAANTKIKRDLFFEAANIGIEQSQQIVVVNESGLPIEYEWVWIDTNTKDVNKACQSKIIEREKRHALEMLRLENGAAADGASPSASPGRGGGGVTFNQNIKPTTAMRHGFESLIPASAQGSRMTQIDSNSASMNTLVQTGHVPANRATENQFSLEPARGVISNEGAETFTISFTPTGLELASQRAVLMLRGVPQVALPDQHQGVHLSRLLHHGHGEFTRLASWIDEMSRVARVQAYKRPNGDMSEKSGLINLLVLFELAVNHANGLVLPSDLSLVEKRLRFVIVHTHLWLKQELDVDEEGDEDENGEDENRLPDVKLELYRWTGDKAVSPDVVTPMSLVHTQYLEEGSDVQTSKAAAAATTPGSGRGSNNNYDDANGSSPPPSRGVTFADAAEIVEEQVGQLYEAKSFTHNELHLLGEMWVDTNNALALLGQYVCEVLDGKVKHEAVDYLKSCSLTNIACLNLTASGEGKPQEVQVSAPELIASGIFVGKVWSGTIDLINTSAADAEVEICADLFTVTGTPAPAPRGGLAARPSSSPSPNQKQQSRDEFDAGPSFQFDNQLNAISESVGSVVLDPLSSAGLAEKLGFGGAAIDSSRFVVEFNPSRILLMPSSSASVQVSITAYCLGEYEIVVPLRSATNDAKIESVTVSLTTVGPQVRFNDAEVDIGLVGVSNEATQTFSFTNIGDVPAMYMLTVIEEAYEAPAIAGGGAINRIASRDTLDDGGGGQNTQRSEVSNTNSIASSRLGGMTVGSGSEAQADSPTAIMSTNPPSGSIAPNETITVTLFCKAGRFPQRVRGALQCRLFDGTGSVEMPTQYLSYRCEIQAPKTILYPMLIDLGVVYTGMPVFFNITTENKSNLPTKYKLERPGGDSPAFLITYDKPKGPLGAKERIDIRCEFVALQPGNIDDLIANKIFGVPDPLGFAIKAVAKSVLVDVVPLSDGASPPPPLANPKATQFPGPGAPPNPEPVYPIDFSANVPLYERGVRCFAIRNLSAIAAPFDLLVRKFVVQDVLDANTNANAVTTTSNESAAVAARNGAASAPPKTGTAGGRTTAGTAKSGRGGGGRPLLVPHEDGENKFHSALGKKYTGAAVERQENRRYLTSGLGASYQIEPRSGIVAPWGVSLITIRTFNDMPGCYDDDLDLVIKDNTGRAPKKISVPLRMTIKGCPLVIEKDSLGMTTTKRAQSNEGEDPAAAAANLLLQMGFASVNAEPLTREFRVRNNGSMPGKVTWRIRSVTNKVNGPIKLELAIDPVSGKIKTHMQYWSDIAKDTPFRIEPTSAIIKPYSKESFRVTLFRTSNVGRENAILTSNVTFGAALVDQEGENNTSSKALLSSASEVSVASTQPGKESTKDSNYRLTLALQGQMLHPSLMLDKKVLLAAGPLTLLPPHQALKFKSPATSLFGRGDSRVPCSKQVTLQNPTAATLVLSISTEGPFGIKLSLADETASAKSVVGVPAAAIGEVDGGGAQSSKSLLGLSLSQPSLRTSVGSDSLGKTLTLLPLASTTFTVSFAPPRTLRETISKPLKPNAGPVPEEKGNLVVAFATGQRLLVPLTASVSTPFLVGSSPRLYFGVCSVGAQCDGTLLLTNPTSVSAKWSVVHVPGAGSMRKVTAIQVPGYPPPPTEEDDPNVFIITPSAGRVEGPTVSVTSAMAAPPHDLNRYPDLDVHPESLLQTQEREKAEEEALRAAALAQQLLKRQTSAVVPQRLTVTSWSPSISTLSLRDTLNKRHDEQGQFIADALYPLPITVQFVPSKNVKYSSRFRFTCEFGNRFDILLVGEGTYEEADHKPLYPQPR